MATTAKRRSGKRERIQAKTRMWRLTVVALAGALVAAAGAAGFLWHRMARMRAAVAEVPIIEPPVIDSGGLDPAVVRAVEKARAAAEQYARSVSAWGRLGKVLLAHDLHGPAVIGLAQAERLDPAQPTWPYLQGLALAAADPPDPIAAIERFQRAVALGGDKPQTLRLRLGEALLGQDRLEEAEQQFERILQLYPDNARANLGLAWLDIRRGDPGKSQAHLEHTLGDPHAKKASRLLWVEVQQRLGKELSPEELQKATDLPDDPGWPDPSSSATTWLRDVRMFCPSSALPV